MKYLLLIYGNAEKWSSLQAEVEDWPAEIAKQEDWNARYKATGELVGAYGLGAGAVSQLVGRKDGVPVVTDGPYLEAKEYVGSFYVIDVDGEDRAREIAADMPWADRYPVEMWRIAHEAR